MSIRRAASCCHPRQEISEPRGARTVRGRAAGWVGVAVVMGVFYSGGEEHGRARTIKDRHGRRGGLRLSVVVPTSLWSSVLFLPLTTAHSAGSTPGRGSGARGGTRGPRTRLSSPRRP